MTEAIATQARVYSDDGKLWVGMTQKDAYQDEKLLELFTFADVNKDRVLDESEILRHNGPSIHINNQGDFYPGLKLENVSQRFQETFREIDATPRDGIIQENEIKDYLDNYNKTSKAKAINTGIASGIIGAISFPLLAKFFTAPQKLSLTKTIGASLCSAVIMGLCTAGFSSLASKVNVQRIAP